jgi:superfamily II DNA or RNA helicase
MRFLIESPVFSKGLDNEAKQFLRSALRYQEPFYVKKKYGGTTKMTNKYMSTKGGIFLTGLVPRVKDTLMQRGMKSIWTFGDIMKEIPLPTTDPYLEGITLREFQDKLIFKAIMTHRGVIKAPARSGKTVIMGGIVSCFQSKFQTILVLMHTKDLLWQTYEEFQRFGFKDIGIVGDGKKEYGHRITIALHQSYVKALGTNGHTHHDLILVDEAHHIASDDGNYGKILKADLAPFRFGVTATPSPELGKRLAMEGLIGPVIGEITQDEARAAEVVTQAKVKIVKVPLNVSVKNIKTYYEAYKKGIVLSRTRNRLIMKTATGLLDEDKTVLILVRRVRHGFELANMFEKFSEYEAPFLCGGIDADTKREMKRLQKDIEKRLTTQKGRSKLQEMYDELQDYKSLEAKIKENNQKRPHYRKALNDRSIRCVIVTNIWNEGINIPTLDAIINAAGGKSEIQTIQAASRSLTASSEKEYGLIVDFFDPNARWFIDHFGERISLYCEEGWL